MLKKAKNIILIIIYLIIGLGLVLRRKKSGQYEIKDVLTIFSEVDFRNDVSNLQKSSIKHLTFTH